MMVGSGAEIGHKIVKPPATKVLSFTGLNPVSSRLCKNGAKKLAKVTCKMGGKNALIVMDDADLERLRPEMHRHLPRAGSCRREGLKLIAGQG
jgi:alpha-ketoglutaric semialdehyde dehydrogenase